MSARSGLRSLALLTASALGALTIAGTAAHADSDDNQKILLKGSTTASYFWDDASGRAGDTGLPASGKPMQKGLAASPSWPLMTEGYVIYKGRKAPFFVGDRGPGAPSNRGIMLDLDAKTFAELTGGTFNPDTLYVEGVGGQGHIDVDYVITKWGPGVGKKNYPVPFSTGAWAERDRNPAKPPQVQAKKETDTEPAAAAKAIGAAIEDAALEKVDLEKAIGTRVTAERVATSQTARKSEPESAGVGGVILLAFLVMAGGGAVLGADRLRRLIRR